MRAIISFILALVTAPFVCAADPIRASELNPHAVIGVLGKPLGSRLVIGGIRGERAMVTNSLALQEIDGARRDGPLIIEIRGVQLRTGVRYKLEGYESGQFAGPPSWYQPGAQAIFTYHAFFVVTKVIEERTLEARRRSPTSRQSETRSSLWVSVAHL
jgi:hypothetical protein